MEATGNWGTSSTARHGKWTTTQDSTLFGPEVRLHFSAGSPEEVPLISSRSTDDLQVSGLNDVPQLPDGSDHG